MIGNFAIATQRLHADRARRGNVPAAYEARKRCFATLVARTIPDAGHMLHHDQPEEVARLIEAFLV